MSAVPVTRRSYTIPTLKWAQQSVVLTALTSLTTLGWVNQYHIPSWSVEPVNEIQHYLIIISCIQQRKTL